MSLSWQSSCDQPRSELDSFCLLPLELSDTSKAGFQGPSGAVSWCNMGPRLFALGEAVS